MTAWKNIRDALESWRGPPVQDWQFESWIKTFAQAGPDAVLGALREVYSEQRDGNRARPTIAEVREKLNPRRVGPDDRRIDPDHKPCTDEERDVWIAKLKEAVGKIGRPMVESPKAVQLRRQREAVKRANARRQRIIQEIHNDGLSGEEADEAAAIELRRLAYAAQGLDYERSQQERRPIKLDRATADG